MLTVAFGVPKNVHKIDIGKPFCDISDCIQLVQIQKKYYMEYVKYVNATTTHPHTKKNKIVSLCVKVCRTKALLKRSEKQTIKNYSQMRAHLFSRSLILKY